MSAMSAMVLMTVVSASTCLGAVLPYSSSAAVVKSERNGGNFAYSVTQDQQSFAPISRALPLSGQMPILPAGSPGYPMHSGMLPGAQTLTYAAHPSLLVPHHSAAAPPALAAYNQHFIMQQPQAHIPHTQYIH